MTNYSAPEVIVERAAARLALRGHTVTDRLYDEIRWVYQPGMDANNLVELVDGYLYHHPTLTYSTYPSWENPI